MSKYNARKTVVDDLKFDSKVESEYYLHLKEQKEIGAIESFELQPKFLLQEGFRKDGKWIKPITYVADFDVWFPDGTREVIDVKGQETEVFKIKKKLFYQKYPYVVLKLVKKTRKGWEEK